MIAKPVSGLLAAVAFLLALVAPASAATITEFPLPEGPLGEKPRPIFITGTPNGTLWYTDFGRPSNNAGQGGVVGAVNTSGEPIATIPDVQATGDITSDSQGVVYWGSLFDGESQVTRRLTSGTVTGHIFDGVGIPYAVGLTASGAERLSGTDPISAEKYSICTPAPENACLAGFDSEITDLTLGPGGVLWAMQAYSDEVLRLTSSGIDIDLTVNLPEGSRPNRGVLGPDGNLWIAGSGTEQTQNRIFRITPDGQQTSFPVPAGRLPWDITVGADGALWFTEFLSNSIGRMTTSGEYSSCPLPSAASNPHPYGITTGSDGNIWFTEREGRKIGRLSGNCVPSSVSPSGDGTEAAKPRVSGLKVKPAAFKAAGSGASIAKRKGGAGSTVSFRLDQSARVTFTVKRKGHGRKVGGKCKRQTSANKGKPACALLLPAKGSFSVAGAAGPNSVGFSGRLRGKALKPGAYRLFATAKGASGAKSSPVSAGFTILAAGGG